MFDVKRIFLSLVLTSFIGTSVFAETDDDKVVSMMKIQVVLLNLMAGIDSLAMEVYLKINNPEISDRVIAQVIKKTRGQQSHSDFANEIGVSRDQLIASEKTGKGLTNELLEKIWQTGTPPTFDEIVALQKQETLVGVSRSEIIVWQATSNEVRWATASLRRLQHYGTTNDGVKPPVSQLLANVKANYGRLLLFAKENMQEISIDSLINKEKIDDQLISGLTATLDNENVLLQHVGRNFLNSKLTELQPSKEEANES